MRDRQQNTLVFFWVFDTNLPWPCQHYYGRRLLWTTPDNAFEYLIGSPNLKYEASKCFSPKSSDELKVTC